MKIQLVAVNSAFVMEPSSGKRFIVGYRFDDYGLAISHLRPATRQLLTILHNAGGLDSIEHEWAVFCFIDGYVDSSATMQARQLLLSLRDDEICELERLGLPRTSGPLIVRNDGIYRDGQLVARK